MFPKTGSEYFATSQPYDKAPYESWKKTQAKDIAEQGPLPGESEEEEDAYTRHMMYLNLRAYLCHESLSSYAECLLKKNVIDSVEKIGTDVNQNLAKVKCPKEYQIYDSCMGTDDNHRTIVFEALQHTACVSYRKDLLVCLESNKNTEETCIPLYRQALRCGLNYLWNDYWRQLTGYGENDEYHTYKGSKEQRRLQAHLDFEKRMNLVADKMSGGNVTELPRG
eukprot:PhM_4_TR2413/c3_g4_i1/m.74343